MLSIEAKLSTNCKFCLKKFLKIFKRNLAQIHVIVEIKELFRVPKRLPKLSWPDSIIIIYSYTNKRTYEPPKWRRVKVKQVTLLVCCPKNHANCNILLVILTELPVAWLEQRVSCTYVFYRQIPYKNHVYTPRLLIDLSTDIKTISSDQKRPK